MSGAGHNYPMDEPGLEEDPIGNAIASLGFGAAADFLANGVVDLGGLVTDEVGGYVLEHVLQMPSDQGQEAESGGQSAAHENAAAPAFDMEQDAAASGFNMEQDVGLVDQFQNDMMHGSWGQDAGDAAHQSGQHDFDDTPDPGDMP